MLESMQVDIASDKDKASPDPDPDKSNYKEIKDGETTRFECYICQKSYPKIKGVKAHIRQVHEKKDSSQSQKKRKTAAEFFEEEEDAEKRLRLEDDSEDVEGFLREIETYWDETEENPTKEMVPNDNNDNLSQFPSQEFSQPVHQKAPEINNIEEAKALVDSLQQEVEVAKANTAEDRFKIESLETAMKTKDDKINISQATINSLEIDKIRNANGIINCKRIFENQKRKIHELEKSSKDKHGNDQVKVLKKAEDDAKKYKKFLQNLIRKRNSEVKLKLTWSE